MNSVASVKESITPIIVNYLEGGIGPCKNLTDLEDTTKVMMQEVLDEVKPDHRVEFVPITMP